MKELVIVFAVGLWVGIVLNFPYQEVFYPTEPYSNVEIKRSEIIDDTYYLVASFIKNECVIKVFEIYGKDTEFDEWVFLPYENIPGPTGQTVTGNRVAGEHTLRVKADISGKEYSKIETRTSHECTETKNDITTIKIVDKIFYTHEIIDE